MEKINRTDILVLCAGYGTRLESILPNLAKVLAPIGDKTFLDVLIDKLSKQGIKRIILCVGHLKEQIKKHIKQNYKSKKISIVISEENEPSGTGGAVKNAISKIKSNPFLVINGDTLCEVNYSDLLNHHHNKKSVISIVLTKQDISSSGNVSFSKSLRIKSFNEKNSNSKVGHANAGVYCINKEIFPHLEKLDNFSLEYEVFPKLIKNNFYGFIIKEQFIDIGTPKNYRKAIRMLT